MIALTKAAEQGRDQFMAVTLICLGVLWYIWARYGKRPRDKQ